MNRTKNLDYLSQSVYAKHNKYGKIQYTHQQQKERCANSSFSIFNDWIFFLRLSLLVQVIFQVGNAVMKQQCEFLIKPLYSSLFKYLLGLRNLVMGSCGTALVYEPRLLGTCLCYLIGSFNKESDASQFSYH